MLMHQFKSEECVKIHTLLTLPALTRIATPTVQHFTLVTNGQKSEFAYRPVYMR
jgi:hypothetical protein